MSGYNGFSKSNNACAAEAAGRFPATRCAKILRVPVAFVRESGTDEWHHTSSYYTPTEYYDLAVLRDYIATEDGRAHLETVRAELAAKKAAQPIVYAPADVTWLEWSGTRNYPVCKTKTATGATVTDRRGAFVQIKLADGTTFRKSAARVGSMSLSMAGW